LDLTASPAESALARADFSLGLLSSSLKGETLEQAMQSFGYIETVVGFEGSAIPKFVLRLVKTDRLYRNEEGVYRNPSSTQIYIRAIKELREHLAIGLRDAKDITDALLAGETWEVEFTNYEGAEKVADALRRSGYFEILVVRR
jgi:2-methylaconitate cis-trans-isomerase PrpF